MRVKKTILGDTRLKTLVDGSIFILYMKSVLFSICRSKKKIFIALTLYDYFSPVLDSELLHCNFRRGLPR